MNAQKANQYQELMRELRQLEGKINDRIFRLFSAKNLRGKATDQTDQKRIQNLRQKLEYVERQIKYLNKLKTQADSDVLLCKFERKVSKLRKYVYNGNYGVSTVSASMLDKSLHVSQLSSSESDV